MNTDEHIDALKVPPGLRELLASFGDDRHPKFPIAYPRPTAQEILMMGGLLCGTKNILGHGRFIDWVKAECPFSYRTAHRYMSAYRGFCRLTKSDTVADLAGNSVPEGGNHADPNLAAEPPTRARKRSR